MVETYTDEEGIEHCDNCGDDVQECACEEG